MPDQSTTARLDQDAGYWPLAFVDPVLPKVGRGSWMNLKVTFCGINASLREWIQVAGLRAATVRARLTRGMEPIQALTTPDHVGRCLQPLSAESLELYRKTWQNALSGVVSMPNGGTTTHVACIIAYGEKIFLGTFQTRDEAVFAFNRAVDLLPGEYDPSDKYEDVDLDLLTRVRIENTVRELFEAAGLKGEMESECGYE